MFRIRTYNQIALRGLERFPRDRFEVAPQNYANKVQGIPVGGEDGGGRTRHRHHGC